MSQRVPGEVPNPEQVTGSRRYLLLSLLQALRRAELLRARWTLLLACGVIAVGAFLKLTAELHEGDLDTLDTSLLERVVALRVPAWNGPAVDITALGSVTVLTIVCLLALCLFAMARDSAAFWQLALAALGGAFSSAMFKRVLERARPNLGLRLVEVESFSYPSGHSLAAASVYLTLALVIGRRMPSRHARLFVISFAFALMTAVGASRAYLGVHYPSDILAGLLLGSGYSLLVSALFSYLRARARARAQRQLDG